MKGILVLLAAATLVQLSKQDTSSCHLRELNLCAATSVVTLRETPIPQNEEQIEEQCKVGKETYDCVNNYIEKCMTKLQREIFSFITEGGRASFDEYCTAGSQLRKLILEKSECLTQAWEEQRTCMSDAQAGVESVNEAPVDKRLDVLCCTYNRYRKCGVEIARNKCGDDIEEWLEKLAGMVISNLPNLVCKNCNNDNAKCEALLPAPGTKPKGSSSDSVVAQFLGIYFDN